MPPQSAGSLAIGWGTTDVVRLVGASPSASPADDVRALLGELGSTATRYGRRPGRCGG